MRLLLSILSLITFLTCNAQDTLKVEFRASSDFNWQDGNVKRLLSTNRAFLNPFIGSLEFPLNSMYSYGMQKGVQTEDEWLITFSPGYKKKWSVFSFNEFESSMLRKIDSRLSCGFGGGRVIKFNSASTLHVSNGFLYEKTEYANGWLTYNTIRNSTRIATRIKAKRFRFNSDIFIQPSIDRNNFKARSTNSLDFPFARNVSFKIGFDYSFESVTYPGRKNFDSRMTVGLTYTPKIKTL